MAFIAFLSRESRSGRNPPTSAIQESGRTGTKHQILTTRAAKQKCAESEENANRARSVQAEALHQ